MNVKDVRNARYTVSGDINCEVQFEGQGDYFPFLASERDSERHGRDVFLSLKAGKWGKVKVYVSPKTDPVEQAERQRRTLLAQASQKIQLWQTQLLLNMISETDKASLMAWMEYIQALQTINTANTSKITWPQPPHLHHGNR